MIGSSGHIYIAPGAKISTNNTITMTTYTSSPFGKVKGHQCRVIGKKNALYGLLKMVSDPCLEGIVINNTKTFKTV